MIYIETDKVFIDSNLWIYLSLSMNDLEKHKKTILFFEELTDKDVNTSIQAINEFHWVLSRKYKLSEGLIADKVDGIVNLSHIFSINFETYQKAKQIREQHQVSFWDSLIIAAALLANCTVLYSEDMHHELIIEDKIKIINPLL